MAELNKSTEVTEDLNKYKMAFKFFDKEDKGKISIEQLANVVYSSVGAEISKAEVKAIAEDMHADEDGYISFEGFTKALKKQEQFCVGVGDNMDRLGSLFEAMDKDGDGVVSASDWQKALDNMGLKMSEEDVQEVLRRASQEKKYDEDYTTEEDEYTTTEEEEVLSGSEEEAAGGVVDTVISEEGELLSDGNEPPHQAEPNEKPI